MNETPKTKQSKKRTPFFITLIFAILVGVLWTGWPGIREQFLAIGAAFTPTIPSNTPTTTITVTETDIPAPIALTEVTLEVQNSVAPYVRDESNGVIVLSLSDGMFKHLFALDPQTMTLSRLTNTPWDDIDPALSPDGARLAFSSRRNGYWNIYILDLITRELTQVTDNYEYVGAPTWSPDGQWLAYETYVGGNLDIFIQSIEDLNQTPIQLTDSPSADHSPAWSPRGREIVFVSDRAGIEDIWSARLDQVEDRFTNLSNNPGSPDSDPAWSPDGRYLAWVGTYNDSERVMILDLEDPQASPRPHSAGNLPVFSPSGDSIVVRQSSIGQVALAAFKLTESGLALPFTILPGEIHGIDWRDSQAEALIQGHFIESPALMPPLWQPVLTLAPLSPPGRYGLVEIPGVNVAIPYLHDAVDESFNALRTEIGRQSGWDVLGNLEYAYLPITESQNPGNVDEWLLTGRAFALNPLPVQAGWMVISREDEGGQVYWRIFIRTRYQDGSQGLPLRVKPWLMDARYSGNPRDYEQGGAYGPIPDGYWIDFTELAARYGWLPLPAIHNWRTFYPAARFNQFAMTDGLSWEAAMAQIYPPEALSVPTAIPSLTITPSITPTVRFYRSPTPQPSLTQTPPPAYRPTWTPLPGNGSP